MLKALRIGLCLLLAVAPVQAQDTKTQLQTLITTDLPDNTSGAITPAILRTVLNTMLVSWQQTPQVRANTSTSDSITVADYGYLITESNASPVAVSLPQATTTFSTFSVYVNNKGVGTVTITPAVSTINGATTLALTQNQTAYIISDGTNWQAAVSVGTAGASSCPAGSNTQVQFNSSASCGASANFTWDGTGITLGVSGTLGRLMIGNATSGMLTVQPVTGALGSPTLSLPAATDTLVGKATTDTLTNKTYDTAGTGNSFSINGVAATANTGTGSVVRATSPTLVTPVLGVATATSLNGLTITSSTGTLTVTNGKTFTAASSITVSGTDSTVMTFPTVSATIPRMVASGSLALATGAISSATCTIAQSASAVGVVTTDVINPGFNSDPTGVTGYAPMTTGMLTIMPYPSADNVNFKVCNLTSSSITPGARTLNWQVLR